MSESQQPGPMLTFHDTDRGPNYPSAIAAQRAGTWAADRGDYRIAQQLLGLAAALEQHELEQIVQSGKRVGGLLADTVRVPRYQGPIRADVPREYRAMPAGPKHPTCQETTSGKDMASGRRTWMCGRDCPGADADTTQVMHPHSSGESVVTEDGHLIDPTTGECKDSCPDKLHG